MTSEQAAEQLAVLQTMYTQDVEQSRALLGIGEVQQFEVHVLKMVVFAVIVFGLVVCALLRPRRSENG
jgi:hypothetical protein